MRICVAFDVVGDPEAFRRSVDMDSFKAPANYKDPVKIAEYIENSRLKAEAEAAEHPFTCDIRGVVILDHSGMARRNASEAIVALNGLYWSCSEIGDPLIVAGLDVIKRLKQLAASGGGRLDPVFWSYAVNDVCTPKVILLDPFFELSAPGMTFRTFADIFCRMEDVDPSLPENQVRVLDSVLDDLGMPKRYPARIT